MSSSSSVDTNTSSSLTSTKSTTSPSSDSSLKPSGLISVRTRRSADRGGDDHGWLNTAHTFSFASYYEPEYSNFHSLRVLNEDRVSGGNGFGRHPHREYEIFSYVVKGSLRHDDSMGNTEILKRGDVQFTSAGTGISHSEFNGDEKEYVHFIQMWVKPNVSQLKPSYATLHWSDEQKLGQLRPIVSSDGRDSSIVIHQNVVVYASILKSDQSLEYEIQPGREIYIHLIQDTTGYSSEAKKTALKVITKKNNDDTETTLLKGGDGAFIKIASATEKGQKKFILSGAGTDGAVAEFLLFDVAKE